MPQTQCSKPIQLTCDDRWRALLVQKILILNPVPQLENNRFALRIDILTDYFDGLQIGSRPGRKQSGPDSNPDNFWIEELKLTD